MKKNIKLLFLAANSDDLVYPLKLDEEVWEIGHEINAAALRDNFDLVSEWCFQATDLRKALQKHKPHIVHFSGHSTKNGIILEDNLGNKKTVNKDAVSELFKLLGENIRIVVLNTCHSTKQAMGIQEFVDFTVGMNMTIKDSSAIIFSKCFYGSLASGHCVQKAFDLAVTDIRLHGESGSDTPELLVRDGADAANAFLVTDTDFSTKELEMRPVSVPGQSIKLGNIRTRILNATNKSDTSLEMPQRIETGTVESDITDLNNTNSVAAPVGESYPPARKQAESNQTHGPNDH